MGDIPDIEDFMYDLADSETTVSHLCEKALGALALLEEACLPDGLRSTRCAIRMTVACVIEISRLADRSKCSRSYLRARLTNIGNQFQTLSREVSVMRAVSSSSSSSARGSVLEKSDGSNVFAPSLALILLDVTPLNSEVSLLDVSLSTAVVEPVFSWVDESILSAKTERLQSAIQRIDLEITAKKSTISRIDEAAVNL
ncbi:unnamed protein product [Lasius platythorax]|uniref:Uncharacterized protein n=1 Tax=Lasius platythorax TaxID=488582 RepID=A0AAV2MZS2_9HYME